MGIGSTKAARSALRAAALAGVALLASAADAPPKDPEFGPHDVETAFYISKSDGEGRVDYGLRLDEKCKPAGDEAVVCYWRHYKDFKPLGGTHSCSWFDRLGYGVASQKTTRSDETGAELVIRLKPVSRELTITTSRGKDGRCQAVVRTTIAGVVKAELESAYLKLKGSMSVEYAELRGKHPESGEALSERMTK